MTDSYFAEEAELLQWDEDRRKEDGRFDNHSCDATLYAWRELRHYRSKPPDDIPEPGTPEAIELDLARMRERRLSGMNRKERRFWDPVQSKSKTPSDW